LRLSLKAADRAVYCISRNRGRRQPAPGTIFNRYAKVVHRKKFFKGVMNMKTDLYVELNGKQTSSKTLMDIAKEIWKEDGRLMKDLNSIELYFKPDECSCYYIMNGTEKGHFFI